MSKEEMREFARNQFPGRYLRVEVEVGSWSIYLGLWEGFRPV